MKTLKTAILALSVAALPLTAFAQGTGPVDATKPVPSAGVNAGVTGNANTGSVPPKVGVTSDTKAGVDGTRADARTGTSATVKPDAKASGTAGGATVGTDAKASGSAKTDAKPAEPAKKPEKHSAVHKDRKHVAAAKTEKHDAVKAETKTDTKTGATTR